MFNVGDKVRLTKEARQTFYIAGFNGSDTATVTDVCKPYGPYTIEVEACGFKRKWDSHWLELVEPKIEKFYIIWCPTYHAPPKVKFYDLPIPPSTHPDYVTGYSDAVNAAETLAKKNPGHEFFVLEMKSLVKCETTPPKLTKAG